MTMPNFMSKAFSYQNLHGGGRRGGGGEGGSWNCVPLGHDSDKNIPGQIG